MKNRKETTTNGLFYTTFPVSPLAYDTPRKKKSFHTTLNPNTTLNTLKD